MKLSALSIFSLCCVVGLVTGCSSSSYNRDADNLVTASGEPLICEDVEVTGTRFAKRVCRTQAEWDAVKGNQRAVADEYGRQTREGSTIIQSPGEGGSPYDR